MNETKPISPAQAGLSVRVIDGPRGTVEDAWTRITYTVALEKDAREVWRGEYHLGVGHVDPKRAGDPWSFRKDRHLTLQEQSMLHQWQRNPGVRFRDPENHAILAAKLAKQQRVQPSLEDVCCSLMLDGQPYFDGETFEEWAEGLGYDTDSRRAEKIYNACMETGRALQANLDHETLNGLREWSYTH